MLRSGREAWRNYRLIGTLKFLKNLTKYAPMFLFVSMIVNHYLYSIYMISDRLSFNTIDQNFSKFLQIIIRNGSTSWFYGWSFKKGSSFGPPIGTQSVMSEMIGMFRVKSTRDIPSPDRDASGTEMSSHDTIFRFQFPWWTFWWEYPDGPANSGIHLIIYNITYHTLSFMNNALGSLKMASASDSSQTIFVLTSSNDFTVIRSCPWGGRKHTPTRKNEAWAQHNLIASVWIQNKRSGGYPDLI